MSNILGQATNFFRSVLPVADNKLDLTFYQYVGIGLTYLFLFSISLILTDYFRGDQLFGFWYPAAGIRFLFLMLYGWRFGIIAGIIEFIASPLFSIRFGVDDIPPMIIASIVIRPVIYALVIEALKKCRLLNFSFTEFAHIAWLCVAIISAPALAAIFSTFLVKGTILVSQDNFWVSVVNFWLGDIVGILMIVPLTLSFISKAHCKKHSRTAIIQPLKSIIGRKFVLEVLVACMVGVFLLLLTNLLFGGVRWLPLLLPTSWLAIRFGFSGSSVVVFLLIITLGVVTTYYTDLSTHLGISFFVPIMSIMLLLLGALSSSRRELQLKLDQQVLHTAHQDRLNSLGEMASILAHELVQPLSVLRLSLGRIKKAQSSNNEDQISELLDETNAAAIRMESIISRVKEFSKRGRLKKQPTTFKKVLTEIEPLISLEAQKLNLDIKYKLQNEDAELLVDIIQVQQCILNLVRNAVASISKIERDNHELLIKSFKSKDFYEIAVSDTGVGITRDMERKLFSPYESSSDNNIGLGLPICQSIIEEHGGSISFQNNKKHGTTFYLRVPLKDTRRAQ